MEDLNDVFTDVAWAVKDTGWSIEHDDLVQELWVWYMENPGVRNRTFQSDKKRRAYFKIQAFNIAMGKLKEDRLFTADYDYSIDVCKGILKGEIKGKQCVVDLAHAIERLRDKNEDYADIIIKRHYSGAWDAPTKPEKDRLTKAYIRLTDEMNKVSRERLAEFDPVPGGTLQDGLGRPKPGETSIDDPRPEPQPVRGYYTKRK